MKNKKVLVSVLALLLVAALFVGVWLLARPETAAGSKNITVTVIHGDGTAKDFHCNTDGEYLGQVLTATGIAEGTEGPYGLEIHSVDGERASWEENQSYWALYVGEEYATTGADGVVLTDGGSYKLVYTIG